MQLGMIGLGRMGANMVRRLMKAGHDCVVYDVSAEAVKARSYNLDIKNPHAVEEDHGDPETLLDNLTAAETEVVAIRDQLKAILSEALAR